MLQLFKQYYPIRNVFFVIGEGVFIFSSVLIASWIILGADEITYQPWLFLKILLITLVCQSSLYYNDLYDIKITDSFNELGIRLLEALGFSAIFLAFVYTILPKASIGRGIFLVSVFFVILLIVSWRFCYTTVLNRGLFNEKVILIGSGDLRKKIKQEIEEKKDCGYTLSLEIPECMEDAKLIDKTSAALIYRNNYEGLCKISRTLDVKKIIISLKEKRNKFPINELIKCRVEGIEVIDANSFYEMLTGKLNVREINPAWLSSLPSSKLY